MLYFKLNQELEVVEVSNKYPDECREAGGKAWARQPGGVWGAGWLNRSDMDQHPDGAMVFAQQIAESVSKLTGRVYLATDDGECVSPRYDVIEAPAVGDDASKGFNGDYYPVGKIVKIFKDFKQINVESPLGIVRFYRRKLTGAWVQTGGTWSLVPGVRSEWNPEF